MDRRNQKYFQEYEELIKEITGQTEKLEKMHNRHITCKAGCDLCCMDYRIFPVEFYAILNNLKNRGFNRSEIQENKEEEDCIFLLDHQCMIYESRPYICRTHGLPLLFANEEAEWELSACELNFTEFDFENFTPDNTFPQDKFNSRLFMLNKKFIRNFNAHQFSDFDLIDLKKMKELL